MEPDVARLARHSTSTLSDALDRLGIAGQALGIAPLDRRFRTAGPAFTDTFCAPITGLPNGGEGTYTGGRYVLAPNAAGRAAWSTYGFRYTNAVVEATVNFTAGTSGMAGLIFWQSADEDYYTFAVTPDG